MAHVPVDGKGHVPDVCIIELGGTVGDIESMPFIEALRQFSFRWEGREGFRFFLSIFHRYKRGYVDILLSNSEERA